MFIELKAVTKIKIICFIAAFLLGLGLAVLTGCKTTQPTATIQLPKVEYSNE